jgi:serine protease AprX
MVEQLDESLRSTNWGKALPFLVIVALLLPVFAATPKVDASPRVQPELLNLAVQKPDSKLSIIVQKLVRDGSVEQAVARLGGRITKDLSIINAFAACVPARAVHTLATTAGVRWISMDAVVGQSSAALPIDSANLQNAYVKAVQADRLWNVLPNMLQGTDVGVAVVDSGINNNLSDFKTATWVNRIQVQARFNSNTSTTQDQYGHGTHVAGILGGDGDRSNGAYIGVAPNVNLIDVKISDDQGVATASDVVAGLQWILNNRGRYNIRVVNMSLNSSVPQSYHVDPLDAAVEVLWFNRIVVVVSAGNNGSSALLPPANDPFVITVGATDDRGTASISDDTIAPFSAYGTTQDGFAKPDLVAPGTNIVSLLSRSSARLAQEHPANVVDGDYFRMSGTSMAAPMVAGVAALLLQDEPNLNPDQVKYRLMNTATRSTTAWPAYSTARAGAGYLNAFAAVNGTTTATANTGTVASHMLWTGTNPPCWDSVNWSSVNWSSVNWSSVNWSSVNWSSVNWSSDYWPNP